MTDYVPMDREEVPACQGEIMDLILELERRIDALECWRDKDETPSPR